jgi:hypothetical protein
MTAILNGELRRFLSYDSTSFVQTDLVCEKDDGDLIIPFSESMDCD